MHACVDPTKSPYYGDFAWAFLQSLNRCQQVREFHTTLLQYRGFVDDSLTYGLGVHLSDKKSELAFCEKYDQLIDVLKGGSKKFKRSLEVKRGWLNHIQDLMDTQECKLGKKMLEGYVWGACTQYADEWIDQALNKLNGKPVKQKNLDAIQAAGEAHFQKMGILSKLDGRRTIVYTVWRMCVTLPLDVL